MVEIEVPSRPSTPRTRSHHASHSPSSDTETPHEITTAFLSEKTTPTTTSSNFFLANDSVNRKTFDFNHLSLPTVTVLSEEAKERRKRKQQRRLCTMSCFFRLFVLFVPFIYMKQISQFLRYIPQAMVPIPRIRQDYSNIHSIYDLSTDNVRPWCFVRTCILYELSTHTEHLQNSMSVFGILLLVAWILQQYTFFLLLFVSITCLLPSNLCL